jgi:hypothetical protein
VASDLLGEAGKFHVEAGEIGEHLGAIGMRSLVRPTERRIDGASGERHDWGAAADVLYSDPNSIK